MKKIAFIVTLAGTTFLVACGPSAEQKAAAEKAHTDSVAAAQHTDSLMQAQKKQHADDSTKAAQMKAADTTKPAETKEEPKKENKK